MNFLHRLTPAQTALLGCFGGLVINLPDLVATRFNVAPLTTRALIAGPPFLLGGLILLLATKRLQRGIRTDHWAPVEVERLRSIVESKAVRALLLCGLIAWATPVFGGHRFRSVGLAGITAYLVITLLQNSVRSPRTTQPDLTLNRTSTQPLSSHHWGDR